jgi:hypothetical protein
MLRRAKRLQEFLTLFCEDDTILCLTKPFFEYTQALSKTRDIIAYHVFRIYNALFEHV